MRDAPSKAAPLRRRTRWNLARLCAAWRRDLPDRLNTRARGALVNPSACSIVSSDVDGNVAVANLERAFLLMPAADKGNVVIRPPH